MAVQPFQYQSEIIIFDAHHLLQAFLAEAKSCLRMPISFMQDKESDLPSSSSIFHERSLAAAAATPADVTESIEIAPYRFEAIQEFDRGGTLSGG